MAKPVPYPLPIPDDLKQQIEAAAERTRLKQAEVMRQSIQLGLPELLRRLLSPDAPLVNVRPLPRGVLSRIYKGQDRKERNLEARATAAQPAPDFDA